MNPNQPLHMRISQNQQTIEQLEVPDLAAALAVILESFGSRKTPANRRVGFVIEIDNQPFSGSLLSREQQLEQEIASRHMQEDEFVFEDITAREMTEALSSPEGEDMMKYQRAENRMGVPTEELMRIKAEWEAKYPKIAASPVGPKWPGF